RPVLPAAWVTVTPQLAADRRRAAAQPFRDRPHPGPGLAQVGDLHPLAFRQIPWRDLPPDRPRGDHRTIMHLPARPGRDPTDVARRLPGPPVEPDDPARLRVVIALRDQPRILLPLLGLRQRSRSPAVPSQPPNLSSVATTARNRPCRRHRPCLGR